LRRGSPVSSCGCFGKADSPPTVSHVVLNLAAAGSHPGTLALLRHQPLAGIPLVGLSATVAYLAYLVMTALPTALPKL